MVDRLLPSPPHPTGPGSATSTSPSGRHPGSSPRSHPTPPPHPATTGSASDAAPPPPPDPDAPRSRSNPPVREHERRRHRRRHRPLPITLNPAKERSDSLSLIGRTHHLDQIQATSCPEPTGHREHSRTPGREGPSRTAVLAGCRRRSTCPYWCGPPGRPTSATGSNVVPSGPLTDPRESLMGFPGVGRRTCIGRRPLRWSSAEGQPTGRSSPYMAASSATGRRI